MKKQVIVALALLISFFSFAQKKELKAAEKALKSNDFVQATSIINQLESMLSSMDSKTKAKYYFLKGSALYANGSASDSDIAMALENLDKVSGAYSSEISALKQVMQTNYLTKANNYYKTSKFSDAAKGFSMLYKVVPTDTTYLYYAASSAVSAKDYDNALAYYYELRDIGYTGIATEYYATSLANSQVEYFTKEERDNLVKLGTHFKPGDSKSESKVSEITKNIALILSAQGKTEEALAAIKDARIDNPENVDLIINEANMYLQLKDEEKFKVLMQEAVKMQPNNADLHYNIGVINMRNKDLENSRSSFYKVLEIDPTYSDAALNLSTSYIDEGNSLIEKMNALGSSAADNIKYDELKAKKSEFFQAGADVLLQFLTKNPDEKNRNILEQLKNIYNAIGDTDKAKEIMAKLESGN